MIDPQPLVAVPAAGLIIPKRIAVRLRVKDAGGVGQAEMKERAEARARLDPAQRIAAPGKRIVYILVGRADVVIPGEDERYLAAQQVLDMADQPFHPGEL